jgi:DNA-directed RNA polymerase subunit RPC12/RpoP
MVRHHQPQPGLLSLPAWDNEVVDEAVDYTDTNICLECGRPAGDSEVNKNVKCPNCGSSKYTKAVRRK